MKKHPLHIYVFGVIIAFIIVNCIVWIMDGEAVLKQALIFTGGFLCGLLGMYIAVHFLNGNDIYKIIIKSYKNL